MQAEQGGLGQAPEGSWGEGLLEKAPSCSTSVSPSLSRCVVRNSPLLGESQPTGKQHVLLRVANIDVHVTGTISEFNISLWVLHCGHYIPRRTIGPRTISKQDENLTLMIRL